MPTWLALALSIAGAYLLGSIPWPYLVVKLLRGVDIRTVGDGFMGTTNVWHVAGLKAAVISFLGDMAKGAAAIMLPGWLGAPLYGGVLAGPATVAGHVWPIFLGFRGGGGAAVALGTLWALLPKETAVLFIAGGIILWRAKGDTFFFNLVVLLGAAPLALLFRETLWDWIAVLSTAATVGARQVQLHGLRMR